MQFDWTVQQFASEHQKELRRQAEKTRLTNLARGEHTGAGGKLLVGLGQQLVNIGQWLQELSGEPVQFQPRTNV